MSTAARISSGSFLSDAWKAWAVPWKLPWMLPGTRIPASARSMAVTASPSATPVGRLNEKVTDGNCPW